MKSMSKMTLALMGIVSLAVGAQTAQALEANGAGSSAGRQFAGLAPVFTCDQSQNVLLPNFVAGAPVPKYFQEDEGNTPPNRVEWQCNVGGVASFLRYSSSNSSGGFNKLPNGANATENYLIVTGCPAGTNTANFKGSGLTVAVSTCATGTLTTPKTVNWGGSDVQATSIHQKIFNVQANPPAAGHLSTNPTVKVPFSIVVGGNVRDGNGALLKTLSDWEIRQIVTNNVANWTDLGYTVSAGSAAIVQCHRSTGSGTLATLDETIVRPKYWGGSFPNVPSATVINAGNSAGMVDCINLHQNSIGYLDSDSVTALNFPNGAYQVGINGHVVNAGALGTGVARLTDLRCGRYIYWADWNMITRGGANFSNSELAPYNQAAGTDALIEALFNAMMSSNPLPDFWLANNDAFAFKADDRGPFTILSPNGNSATVGAVCKSGASTQ